MRVQLLAYPHNGPRPHDAKCFGSRSIRSNLGDPEHFGTRMLRHPTYAPCTSGFRRHSNYSLQHGRVTSELRPRLSDRLDIVVLPAPACDTPGHILFGYLNIHTVKRPHWIKVRQSWCLEPRQVYDVQTVQGASRHAISHI